MDNQKKETDKKLEVIADKKMESFDMPNASKSETFNMPESPTVRQAHRPALSEPKGPTAPEPAPEQEVTVIRTKGHTSLVQWVDKAGMQRAWLPSNKATKDDPSLGVPFGDEIADALTIRVKPGDIEQALRRAGIWTWEDVMNQAPTLPGILQDAFGVLNQLLATARKELKDG